MVQEFQYQPTRWAKLAVADDLTQADVDAVFASVDTSGWEVPPTWDAVDKVVRWQGGATARELVALGAGAVVCVERPYVQGVGAPPWPYAQVITYAPGEWSDSAVTYL